MACISTTPTGLPLDWSSSTIGPFHYEFCFPERKFGFLDFPHDYCSLLGLVVLFWPYTKGHKNTGSTRSPHFQISRPRPPSFESIGNISKALVLNGSISPLEACKACLPINGVKLTQNRMVHTLSRRIFFLKISKGELQNAGRVPNAGELPSPANARPPN